ncbi:MAG: flavodoxin family protein [Candidatus Hodarchaeota archaeon]
MGLLVVFYSRTGNTKKIGELISRELNCEYEEIFDTKKRSGFIGFIRAGADATRKKLTIIKEIEKNPENYDLVILGTPIWNRRMSTPIRTYITEYRSKIKNVAFFCTMGGKGNHKAFESMMHLFDKQPIATLEINKKEIKERVYDDKIRKFILSLT